MADVRLTYKNNVILDLSNTGVKTLQTAGKYCESDIILSYIKPVGDVFAVIFVSYPEGSTCTCSNGATVLNAESTSGTWFFNIPHTGTWTVTAHLGDESASQNVQIENYGDYVKVDLAFGYMLYNYGNEYAGWTATGKKANSSASAVAVAPTVTKNTDSIVAELTANKQSGTFIYNEKVSFVGYEKIIAEGTFVNNTPFANNALAIWSTLGTIYEAGRIAQTSIASRPTTSSPPVTVNKLELTIPTGTTSGYVGFILNSNGNTGDTASFTINKCYLK